MSPQGAGFDIVVEVPSVEETLAEGWAASAQSPVHIALRATVADDSVRCNWHGMARTSERREEGIRFWLGIGEDVDLPSIEEIERFVEHLGVYVYIVRPRFLAAT